MTTSNPDTLPNPHRVQSPEEHRAMSQRFLVHAQRELNARRRLQASEKIWGAVAHQLAAVAEQRGWMHQTHNQFRDAIHYLAKEHGRRDLVDNFSSLEGFHSNFYSNAQTSPEIQEGIEDATRYVADLEAIRQAPMRPFTIDSRRDQGIVRRLTGRAPSLQETRPQGFRDEANLRRRRTEWGQGEPDDPLNGVASQPTPPSPQGSAGSARQLPTEQPGPRPGRNPNLPQGNGDSPERATDRHGRVDVDLGRHLREAGHVSEPEVVIYDRTKPKGKQQESHAPRRRGATGGKPASPKQEHTKRARQYPSGRTIKRSRGRCYRLRVVSGVRLTARPGP